MKWSVAYLLSVIYICITIIIVAINDPAITPFAITTLLIITIVAFLLGDD